jgi:peptide/nickel transport system permease protein
VPRVRNYVLRRLLIAIPSLLIASVIVFALPRLIPGDVVQLMLEEKAYGKDLDDRRAKLGLDRPIPVQYAVWLGAIGRGELGESLWTRQAVLTELARRLPVTLTLGAMAIAVAILIGVPVGIISAVRQDGVLDFFARSAAILGLSIPAFVKAIVIILLPAIWWGWTPMIRFVEFSKDPATHVLQFVLPAVILGIASAAAIMRLTRGMLLEVLRQDYVRTAWAKGLRERVVVLKHALKNAIIPVVTVLGLQVAQIAGGAVIIETIFSLPGMGQLLVESIIQRDYPVIQGINLLVVTIIVMTNLAVDLCYAVLDPRIRY